MERGESLEGARLALRTSPSCLLTGKLSSGTATHNLSFSPSTHVYSHIETGAFSHHDETTAAQIVESIRSKGAHEVLGGSGGARGLLSSGWTMREVADLLDLFAYTGHNPDPARYPMPELYRPADQEHDTGRLLDTNNDPYVVAAYLRFWAAQKGETPPFNVGVTFGSMKEDNAPFDFPLLNRKISSRGRMEGAWSGASGEWRGDAFFDDPPGELVGHTGLRLEGCPGLLLLHVVHKLGRGKSGDGMVRGSHSPAVGLAIPQGGPAFSVVVNYAM